VSEFRSVHRINDDKMYVIANRLIVNVHNAVHANRAMVERIKLSPLLGLLAHQGPETLIDYVKPKKDKETRYLPKWTAIGFSDDGSPDSVVTVRPGAELEIGSGGRVQSLKCTLVDVVSVSIDGENYLDGAKTGLEVSKTAFNSDDPIVAIEKIPKKLIKDRQRWLRGDQNIDDFPDISHEEATIRLAFGRAAFTGNILRDDKCGVFDRSHFGTVFSDREILPLTDA
jgi:hypothetical protein